MRQTVLLIDADSSWILRHSIWKRITRQVGETCVLHASTEITLEDIADNITSTEKKCFLITQDPAWQTQAKALGWDYADTWCAVGIVSTWLIHHKRSEKLDVNVVRKQSSLLNYADHQASPSTDAFCSLS